MNFRVFVTLCKDISFWFGLVFFICYVIKIKTLNHEVILNVDLKNDDILSFKLRCDKIHDTNFLKELLNECNTKVFIKHPTTCNYSQCLYGKNYTKFVLNCPTHYIFQYYSKRYEKCEYVSLEENILKTFIGGCLLIYIISEIGLLINRCCFNNND